MKKLPNYLHRFVGFVKSELEMTLAVLVVLAFVIGSTYADATIDLDSGDVEIAQEASINQFGINGAQYNAINFSTAPAPGHFRVRTGISPYNVTQTIAGVAGKTPGDTYTYTVLLSPPFTGNIYVHGTYNSVSINGHTVQNSSEPAYLENATNLKLTFAGGDVIKGMFNYPSTSENIAPTVETLYLMPTVGNVAVNSSRTFAVIALDAAGSIISSIVPVWSIVEGKNYATIDSITGILTGNVAGGPVKVKATVNGATALATVTVQQPQKQISLPTPPTTTTPTPSTDGETGIDTTTPTPSVQTPNTVIDNILDFFADEQTVQPSEEIDNTYSTPAESSAVAQSAPTTFIKKVASGIASVATGIKNTITGIFVSRTYQSTETGETVVVPSVFQNMRAFFSRLFLGVNPEIGEGSAGASTGDATPTGINEQEGGDDAF